MITELRKNLGFIAVGAVVLFGIHCISKKWHFTKAL